MSFNLLTCNINNNDISIPIDTNIELSFSSPVEEFSVPNGISIYSLSSQTWTGSLMSQMDSKTSDVKSQADQVNIVEYSYTVSGSNVYIKPNKPLEQKIKYYIQLAPGLDPSRFVTASTYDAPNYNYINPSISTGLVEVTSPYSGKSNCIFTLTFNNQNEFDLSINNIYDGTHRFTQYKEFTINKMLNISINGIFNNGDTVVINCYAPVGLSTINKIAFTTSEYIEATVKSTNIEDKLYASMLSEFKIVSTIPSSMSVNNNRVNPIIIKFNKTLNAVNLSDIVEKIRIFKLNFSNGSTKKITFYPKADGNILKLYMVSVDNLSEITSLPIYEVASDTLSTFDDYKLVSQ